MESHICWLQWLTFYADNHNFFHIIPHRKISGLTTRTRWFMIFYLLVLWGLLMFVFRWFSSPVLLWPRLFSLEMAKSKWMNALPLIQFNSSTVRLLMRKKSQENKTWSFWREYNWHRIEKNKKNPYYTS